MERIFSVLLASVLVVVSSSSAGEILPGIRADNTTTTASFTLALSLAESASEVTAALTTDDVRVTGTIIPEPEQLGQQADIFVVAQIGNTFFMRTQGGSFVTWDGALPTLLPFQTTTLEAEITVDFYTGKIADPATYYFYLGYEADDGVLVYTALPHQVMVSAPTATLTGPRPYMNLTDFGGVSTDSSAYDRFFTMVDRWVLSGIRNEYNYSPVHSVIAYALTADNRYIQSAIADTDAYVEAQIASACSASKSPPSIGGDSYLGAGTAIQKIALTYDYGFDLLTAAQRTHWLALMTQVANNIWGKPSEATWGGPDMGCTAKRIGWSGWAVYPPYGPNPGNNYYHASFARVAMLLALVTRDPQWLDLVQQKIIPDITNYFAAKVPEGGSREGTGYGVSHMNLFDLYRVWLASAHVDLARQSPHVKNTINYWLHATVPTLDQLVPIGDQARVSEPRVYDYHRMIMLEAQLLSPGTAEARWANWWLDNTPLTRMSSGSNSQFELLRRVALPEQPTQLGYYARGAGVYFARSSWEKTATHFSMVVGQFEESHAAQEQGGFSFFKNGWLAVTSNIWSHSGINQNTGSRNVLRFDKTDGTAVPQNRYTDTIAPVLVEVTDADGTKRGSADLSVAYSQNMALVQSWTRDFSYKDNRVTIHDTCQVSPSITPVWQVHVPSEPLLDAATGTITTADGRLSITSEMPVSKVVIEEMKNLSSDFAAGRYRISLYSQGSCEFMVTLRAL